MSSLKSSGISPPVLPDAEKFDGTNFLEWRETILMACRVRGARGYLEGTINNPALPPTTSDATTTPLPFPPSTQTSDAQPTETAWTSLNPSAEEWDARDAWCMLAITQNIKNPIGLGVTLDGSAADAWKSLEKRYKTSTDLARVYAQRELRLLKLEEGGDYQQHIAELHLRHRRANAVGAKIGDADFREIIINSLPPSWDVIIASLHNLTTSTDVIIHLDMHWSRIGRNAKVKAPGTSAIALKANSRHDSYNKRICTNPNCGRRGHTIENCYWTGGGKEGQFPAGFGQRGGGTSNTTPKPNTNQTPTANAAVVQAM